MSRPVHRIPPNERVRTDGLTLAYDMSAKYGWGTYPEHGVRGGNVTVWEEGKDRSKKARQNPLLGSLSDDSLQNLLTIGQQLGMES